MTTATFPITDLQRLRKRAAKLACAPLFGPERWSRSTVDPMRVLAVFKCLSIKEGYILRAYQRREDGKCNGVVWAMPADAEFPDPRDCKKDRKHVLQPPRPPAALDDEMAAIEGAGSPWSYLCASILGRELWTFGRSENQGGWGCRTILGRNPLKWKTRPKETTAMPSSDPAAWIWHQPEPKEWRPQIMEDGEKLAVTFFTYSGHGREHITRHKDTFRQGSYCHKGRTKDIAVGPGGYDF